MFKKTADITQRIKKLQYQSHYRGTKEADFIFSRFASEHLVNFTHADLSAYEAVLSCPDAVLMPVLFQNAPVPESLCPAMVAFIKRHAT